MIYQNKNSNLICKFQTHVVKNNVKVCNIQLPIKSWEHNYDHVCLMFATPGGKCKYTQQNAQMGFRVNPVLARSNCISCYISLFTEIILQQLDAFKIEIQGILKKL